MMLAFTLLLSRLVPILFFASFVLVAARFMHDRYADSNKTLGRLIMAAILMVGVICMAPFLMRAVAVTLAEASYLEGNWDRADRFFSLQHRMNGRIGERLARDWIEALMNQRKWRPAERVIQQTVERKEGHVRALPETILLLGICRYYDNRLEEAFRTFRAVERPREEYLKSYFLGRIAERRGNLPEALAGYNRALAAAPHFFPALYQAVRVQLLTGDREAAGRVLSGYLQAGSGPVEPLWEECSRAARGGPVPAPREFMLVQVSR